MLRRVSDGFSRIFRPTRNQPVSNKRPTRLSLNRSPPISNYPNQHTKSKVRLNRAPLTLRRYSKLNSPNREDSNKTPRARHSRRSMKSMRSVSARYSKAKSRKNQASNILEQAKFNQLMKLNKKQRLPNNFGNILGLNYNLNQLNNAIKTIGFDPYLDHRPSAKLRMYHKYRDLNNKFKELYPNDDYKRKKLLKMYDILSNHIDLLRFGVENI